MANCPHSDFKRGQKILIIFKDGKQARDIFLESKSGVIITKRLGRTPLSKVRATVIWKP